MPTAAPGNIMAILKGLARVFPLSGGLLFLWCFSTSGPEVFVL